MVALPPMDNDPTIDKMLEIIQARADAEPPRKYLGASSIGEECERKLWYGYNGYPKRQRNIKGILAAEDGHRTEDLMIERLCAVPGVQVWTKTEEGKQYGFRKYDGRYAGHYDGVVVGLLQAPKTFHILEVKACKEDLFEKFLKAKIKYGDKHALEAWNPVYYAQAQTYMGEEKLDRHYTLVAMAGGRFFASARTEFNPAKYNLLDKKALRILNAKSEPARISEYKENFGCKWCDFKEVCHG